VSAIERTESRHAIDGGIPCRSITGTRTGPQIYRRQLKRHRRYRALPSLDSRKIQAQIANQRGEPLVEFRHDQRLLTFDMKEQEQRVFQDIVAIAGLDAVDAIDRHFPQPESAGTANNGSRVAIEANSNTGDQTFAQPPEQRSPDER
jgi:hypothetical protein